jgi:predicted DNA-binding protein (MmcQ/YjbR family)
MNIDAIREYCLSFPDATEGLQWGDDLLFRVRGKIFVSVPLDASAPVRITFKTTPEKILELLEIEGVERAAYVGRYNWVSLQSLDALHWAELKDLIRQSYELVAAKAPKKRKASRASKSAKRLKRSRPKKRSTRRTRKKRS